MLKIDVERKKKGETNSLNSYMAGLFNSSFIGGVFVFIFTMMFTLFKTPKPIKVEGCRVRDNKPDKVIMPRTRKGLT